MLVLRIRLRTKMTDIQFLREQRKSHIAITVGWSLIIGLPLYLFTENIYGAIGFGVLPPLMATILNWNDTSRYC